MAYRGLWSQSPRKYTPTQKSVAAAQLPDTLQSEQASVHTHTNRKRSAAHVARTAIYGYRRDVDVHLTGYSKLYLMKISSIPSFNPFSLCPLESLSYFLLFLSFIHASPLPYVPIPFLMHLFLFTSSYPTFFVYSDKSRRMKSINFRTS